MPKRPATPDAAALATEIAELRQRIEKLEAAVAPRRATRSKPPVPRMLEALEDAAPNATDIEPGESWGFRPPGRGAD